jgi:hypothetical protein
VDGFMKKQQEVMVEYWKGYVNTKSVVGRVHGGVDV